MRRLAALAGAVLIIASCQQADPGRTEDRAEIHDLLLQYGRTLDARDFDGFAALFAHDGTYVAGGGGAELSGAQAGEAMRKVFAENAMGFGEPAFHMFFGESVHFTGSDSATANSRSFYVVPGEGGRPTPAMMAEYDDRLVREDGHWKFARRQVKALLPAPPENGR